MDGNAEARIVGIIGTPYCGSTMLARLFGGLKGVSSPGELCHLALTSKVEGWVRRRKPESGGWPVVCAKCRYSCPIFPKDYILKEHDPREVYQDVARRLKQPVMVVADKSPAHFEASIDPGLMDGIVLFKQPAGAVFSITKRKGSAQKAIDAWVERYGHALEWAPKFCKRVLFVSYDEVASRPVMALRTMCRELELPAPGPKHHWMPARTYHYLGGNGGTHTRNEVRRDVAWQRGLAPPVVAMVEKHGEMQRIYQEMMSRRLRVDGANKAS